jgi:uncharacterized protein
MEKESRFYDIKPELRLKEDGQGRTVEGYALIFDKESRDLGGFIEVIDRSALDGADMSDVIARTDHNNSYVLARTSAGTLDLTVDAKGLLYRFDAPNTTAGNDLIENVRNGNIPASSFAFTIGGDKWEKRDGKHYRTITSFKKIYDVAPVVEPAYPDTTVAARSLEEQKKEEVVVDTYDSRHKNLDLTIKLLKVD